MPTEVVTIRPSRGTALAQFFRGMGYPFRGMAFLWRHRDLWDVAIGPLLITMGMISLAAFGALMLGDDLLGLFWTHPDPAVDLGGSVAWELAANLVRFLLFVVLAVVFWILGNMIGSPFWDVLAERTERHLLDREETHFDIVVALGDAWLSIKHSIAALGLYVVVMGGLFVLNFVPGIGSALYAVLSWPATVFFVVREVMDVPLSRRRTPFREKLLWMRAHGPLMAGLGTTSLLLFLIPLVDIFVMPVAVMGGTLLYCHLHLEGHGVPQRGPGGRPAALPEPSAAGPEVS
jgi:CysZ protein